MNVLVVGAGPAGTRTAELLAKNGLEVTLVERLESPQQNSFSSAVVPINTIKERQIPITAISSYWQNWHLIGPNQKSYIWSNHSSLGAVLDFSVLREQMWLNARKAGIEFLLGWKVLLVESRVDSAEVVLINRSGHIVRKIVEWVVDATGFNRSFLDPENRLISKKKGSFQLGLGIEMIIQGNYLMSQKWQNSISFFIGTKWIPYGYGWVFPMSRNQIKIGVCRLNPNINEILPPLSLYLKKLLRKTGLDSFPVIDKHGGVISSSIKRKESVINGRVIGVGDSISTANLLGGEGIRHALLSSEILASLFLDVLNEEINEKEKIKRFKTIYQKKMDKLFGFRWRLSNQIGVYTWNKLNSGKSDKRILSLIEGLSESSTAEDISALLFDYRFERYGIKLLPYLLGWRQ